MPEDPGSVFGGLLNVCVRDQYVKEPRIIVEGVLVMLLGIACSVATTVALSAAGFLL